MVRDGIYQAIYSGSGYKARGMFVFRKGAFVGIGQTGAIYEGAYYPNSTEQVFDFDGCVRFPAGTELVTGPGIHEKELTIPFKGHSAMQNGEAKFVLNFDGQPVDVTLTFVSPIPG